MPRERERLTALLASLAVAFYAGRAVIQLLALRQEAGTGDFKVFYQAAVDLARGSDPYRSFLDVCHGDHWCLGGYIYPPLLALVLRPLTSLDAIGAQAVWTIASHAMLIAAALVTYATIRNHLPRGAGRIVLAAALFFLPLYQNLYSGSVGAPLVLLLAISAWAYVSGKNGWAGVVLGAGAVLRVTPAAIAPVMLRTRAEARRPVGVVALGAMVAGSFALLALITPFTIEYLTRVLPKISGTTAFYSNVSLPGVLLRLQLALFGRALPGSTLVGLVVAIAVLGITWWQALRLDGRPARAVAFAAFLAATSLVSSVTWNYHLVNELLVFALLLPWLDRGRRATGLAIVAYPLLWIYSDGVLAAIGLRPEGAVGTSAFLVITSLNAAGMLLLWLATLDVLRGLRRELVAPSRDPGVIDL
jgi:hypothetical protein